MAPDQFDLPAEDRELLARLGELTDAELSMPDSVAEAAKALHDWAGVDAILAELVDEPVTTRGDGTAFNYVAGHARVRAEIEPSGYRRRRLVISAHASGRGAEHVQTQGGDGTVHDVAPDSFGEHVVDLPSGPVRVIAQFAATRVATPWFTI